MQKLKRSINMGFRVTEEEQGQIRQRMSEAGIGNVRAYLLKMALSGHVIKLDLTEVNECSRLLRSVSNNVNQIAKHANTVGAAHSKDIAEIKARLNDVWGQQDRIIRALAKAVGVS